MIESLLFPLASLHVNTPEPRSYNEVNPGIIAETTGGYLLGAYHNSRSRVTALAAKRITFAPGLSAVAGLCTGYRTPVCGALAFSPVRQVELTYIPRIGKLNSDTFGLAIRVPL